MIGVIWVSRTECLRLGNIGKDLGTGDQVDVRGAIDQGCPQFFDSLDSLGEGAADRGSCTSLCPAAGNHDCSGPEVLLLVDAQRGNARTVKSVRNEGVGGIGDNVILLLRLCDAKARQRQKDAGQDYKQSD